jgi:hypothetical protein
MAPLTRFFVFSSRFHLHVGHTAKFRRAKQFLGRFATGRAIEFHLPAAWISWITKKGRSQSAFHQPVDTWGMSPQNDGGVYSKHGDISPTFSETAGHSGIYRTINDVDLGILFVCK